MDAKIFKPSKNAMQSARAGNAAQWVLEYISPSARNAEPLMGWTSAGDTLEQVRLKFKTCAEAIEFAKQKGLNYVVQPEHKRRVKPKNYTDNFKYVPAGDAKKS